MPYVMAGLIFCAVAFAGLKIAKVSFERNQALAKLEQALEQNQRLQAENAVSTQQIKHYQARGKNEEMVISLERDAVINRLHEQGDLRD